MIRSKLVAVVVGIGLVGSVAGTALAQDAGGPPPQGGQGGPGGGPGGRRNFDPAQMRQRMMDRLKEQLGASEDEWKVIQPKLEKVQTMQFQSMMGRFGGGRRGMGGPGGGFGGPGGDANAPANPVREATRALQEVLDNKDSTPEQIKVKLQALRDARAKAHEELVAAQNELKEVLTQRQEAVLVENGMLE